MTAPWAAEVSFLPPFGRRLSEALHANGFTLDFTKYMYAFFGCREVVFRHPHTKCWLRIFYDGKEDEWLVDLSRVDGRRAPSLWISGRHWARWAGLTTTPTPDDQVNEILSERISEVLAKMCEDRADVVMAGASSALNGPVT